MRQLPQLLQQQQLYSPPLSPPKDKWWDHRSNRNLDQSKCCKHHLQNLEHKEEEVARVRERWRCRKKKSFQETSDASTLAQTRKRDTNKCAQAKNRPKEGNLFTKFLCAGRSGTIGPPRAETKEEQKRATREVKRGQRKTPERRRLPKPPSSCALPGRHPCITSAAMHETRLGPERACGYVGDRFHF